MLLLLRPHDDFAALQSCLLHSSMVTAETRVPVSRCSPSRYCNSHMRCRRQPTWARRLGRSSRSCPLQRHYPHSLPARRSPAANPSQQQRRLRPALHAHGGRQRPRPSAEQLRCCWSPFGRMAWLSLQAWPSLQAWRSLQVWLRDRLPLLVALIVARDCCSLQLQHVSCRLISCCIDFGGFVLTMTLEFCAGRHRALLSAKETARILTFRQPGITWNAEAALPMTAACAHEQRPDTRPGRRAGLPEQVSIANSAPACV